MMDGAYRLELEGRALRLVVRDGHVVEAEPALERAIGRPAGEVRRWVKQQGGFMLRIHGKRRIARGESC